MGSVRYDFKGDVVVVTGAASGIGKDTALAFAEAGADLALCDYNEAGVHAVAASCAEYGVKAVGYRMDVTNTARVTQARDEILAEFGKVTCLFSNAGIPQDIMGPPLENIPDATWEQTIGVNTIGTVKVCRAFMQPMKAAKYGKIVMTSSYAAYSCTKLMPAYSVSKMGVLSFMESLCDELGAYNINVNAVNPGFVYTPMYENDSAPKIRDKVPALAAIDDPKKVVEALAARSALARMQTTRDIANGVMFLCSEAAKEITGQILNIDSGCARRI